jgi:hypothetical protein
MRTVILLTIITAALLLFGCGTHTVVAPDPCAGARPVTARFTIYEVLESGTKAPSDTLANGLAHFAADERYDSCEWQIGSDTRIRTGSAFTLRFPGREVVYGEPIPIRLIARRKPDTACLPDDDGVDTAYRYLVPLPPTRSPLLGSYHGAHVDDPADTFTVTIYVRYIEDSKDMCDIVMRNVNRGCSDTSRVSCTAVNDKDFGATIMEFDGDGSYRIADGCLNPKGIARLKGRDTIEIDYVYDEARIPKKFIGRRVK